MTDTSQQDTNEPEFSSDQERIATEAKAKVESEAPALSQVPFDLVERHKNKTTQLLANSGTPTRIDSRSRWHDYDFKEALFISFIRIKGEDLSEYADFKIRISMEDGSKKDIALRPSGGVLTAAVNEFCTSIAFKPPSASIIASFMSNPTLTGVAIWGFRRADISQFLGAISKIDALKNAAVQEITAIKDQTDTEIGKLEHKEVELADVHTSISEAEDRLGILEHEIARRRETSAELKSTNSSISSQLKTLEAQIEEREAQLATSTKSREDINLEVERSRSELKKLRENINLFPSEVSGFVDQASRDIKMYMLFSAAMITIIATLFIWVLTGAFDLSEYVKENPDVSIWPLFLAKLPLAATVSALVAACYKITRVFIEELLKINRQKLSLTQVSIIAKDSSTSAEAGLELSDSEIYGLRLRTKMALLSDHIKTFVPTDAEELLPQHLFDSTMDEERRSDDIPTLTLSPEEIAHLEGSENGDDDTK